MEGETNLQKLLQTMQPKLNAGEYVFCTIKNLDLVDATKIISFLRKLKVIQ